MIEEITILRIHLGVGGETNEVMKVHNDIKNLLVEYDRKFYPASYARSASLLFVLTKIQQVPEYLGRLFFPKLVDVRKLIHHIQIIVTNESIKHFVK